MKHHSKNKNNTSSLSRDTSLRNPRSSLTNNNAYSRQSRNVSLCKQNSFVNQKGKNRSEGVSHQNSHRLILGEKQKNRQEYIHHKKIKTIQYDNYDNKSINKINNKNNLKNKRKQKFMQNKMDKNKEKKKSNINSSSIRANDGLMNKMEQNKCLQKQNCMSLKDEIKRKTGMNYKQTQQILQKKQVKQRFMEMVELYFNGKNRLSEVQKQGNESILYFFGPLFHKAKLKKQKIYSYQLYKQVDKIYQLSSLADIKKCLQILQYNYHHPQIKQSKIQNPYILNQNINQRLTKLMEQCKHKNQKLKSQIHKSDAQSKSKHVYIDHLYSKYQHKPDLLKNIQLKVSRNQAQIQQQSKIQKRIILNNNPSPQMKASKQKSLIQSIKYDGTNRTSSYQGSYINQRRLQQKKDRDEDKLSLLSQKLQLNIQRYNKHLQTSKNVRIQNGFL